MTHISLPNHVPDHKTISQDDFDQVLTIFIDAFNTNAGFEAWNLESAKDCLTQLLLHGEVHLVRNAQAQIAGFAITQELSCFEESGQCIRAGSNPAALFIAKFAIEKDARGTGVSKKLIGTLIEGVRGKDYKEIVLRVRDGNVAMEKLVEGYQFVRQGSYCGIAQGQQAVTWNIYALRLWQGSTDLSGLSKR